MSSEIDDYALLGDGEAAALVGRDGSIDWHCWPRFDSSACFATLVGGREHGRWLITTADKAARISRHYRDDTLILETNFETAEGAVTLVDFMPPRGTTSNVVRVIVGRRDRVAMRNKAPDQPIGTKAPRKADQRWWGSGTKGKHVLWYECRGREGRRCSTM